LDGSLCWKFLQTLASSFAQQQVRRSSGFSVATLLLVAFAVVSPPGAQSRPVLAAPTSARHDFDGDGDVVHVQPTNVSCVDCSAFNRMSGRDPCPRLSEDCGECKPGFAVLDRLSMRNGHSEVCARLLLNQPPVKIGETKFAVVYQPLNL
jgi:hypothetical protein